jgi:two-component system KDP operon response regulator KdpE
VTGRARKSGAQLGSIMDEEMAIFGERPDEDVRPAPGSSAVERKTPAPVVVVVEDKREILRSLRYALEGGGWQVVESTTIKHGLVDCQLRRPDLVILDLRLPDGHGVDFLRELRLWSRIPVIVLSALSEEREKVAALDAGADDYLTKPFGVNELLARARASQRRRSSTNGVMGQSLEIGNVSIDLDSRSVRKSSAYVHLTPIEYRILSFLAETAGRIVTMEQIVSHLWGPARDGGAHGVRVHIRSLRQKLEDDPARPRLIITETGIGYRLVE